jgi:hypothetical protein
MSSASTWTDHFPGNFMWSNATLVCKGMAPYGAVALGEIDRICERLAARGMGDADAWWQEWCAMAERNEKLADAAAAEGRGPLPARGQLLLHRRALRSAGRAQARHLQEGAALLSGGAEAPAQEHRVRRSALRRQDAAGVLHEG